MGDDVAELRKDLTLLKLRIDAVEVRIAAAETKQQNDHDQLKGGLANIVTAMSALATNVGNLATQVRASHYSLVHLLSVTARQVKVPDADLDEALRLAKEAIR